MRLYARPGVVGGLLQLSQVLPVREAYAVGHSELRVPPHGLRQAELGAENTDVCRLENRRLSTADRQRKRSFRSKFVIMRLLHYAVTSTNTSASCIRCQKQMQNRTSTNTGRLL